MTDRERLKAILAHCVRYPNGRNKTTRSLFFPAGWDTVIVPPPPPPPPPPPSTGFGDLGAYEHR